MKRRWCARHCFLVVLARGSAALTGVDILQNSVSSLAVLPSLAFAGPSEGTPLHLWRSRFLAFHAIFFTFCCPFPHSWSSFSRPLARTWRPRQAKEREQLSAESQRLELQLSEAKQRLLALRDDCRAMNLASRAPKGRRLKE